jgi:hypothetical protein
MKPPDTRRSLLSHCLRPYQLPWRPLLLPELDKPQVRPDIPCAQRQGLSACHRYAGARCTAPRVGLPGSEGQQGTRWMLCQQALAFTLQCAARKCGM